MIGGVFRVAIGVVNGIDSIDGKWREGAWWCVGGFGGRGLGPAVSAKKAVDVFCAREHGAVAKLGDIDAVEVVEEAEIAERGDSFGRELEFGSNKGENAFSNIFGGGGKSEVVDLTEKEERLVFKRATVDGAIMCGWVESKFWEGQDGRDMGLP